MPQLLEVLSILFETDADKARQSVGLLDKALDDVANAATVSVKEAGTFNELLTGLGTEAQKAAQLLTSMSDADIDFSEQIGALAALQDEFDLIPTDEEAIDAGARLGFDEETVKLLRSGRTGLEELTGRIKEAENPTKILDAQFGALTRTIAVAAAAATAAGVTIFAAIASAGPTDELGKLSQLLDTNVSDVDRWDKAVEAAGGSSGQFRSSLEGLTKALTRLTFAGDPAIARDLNRVGVSIRRANGEIKSAIELIPELAEAFQKAPKGDVLAIGERLGIDRGTILLFQQGGEELANMLSLITRLGVVTDQQADISREFNKEWFLLGVQFETISRELGSVLLPILTSTMRFIREFITVLRENATFAATFFTGLAAAITVTFLPAIKAAAVAIGVFLAPFLIVGLKIAAIIAVVASLALVVEDLITFFRGGKSVIGDFFDTLSKKAAQAKEDYAPLIAVLGAVVELVKAHVLLMTDMFTDPLAALENFYKRVLQVFADLKEAFKDIDLFSGLKEGFNDFLSGVPFLGGRGGVRGASPSSFGAGELADAGRGALTNISAISAITPTQGPASASKTLSVTIDRVEVHTQATDAQGIAESVGGALNTQLAHVLNQFDDGVRV